MSHSLKCCVLTYKERDAISSTISQQLLTIDGGLLTMRILQLPFILEKNKQTGKMNTLTASNVYPYLF